MDSTGTSRRAADTQGPYIGRLPAVAGKVLTKAANWFEKYLLILVIGGFFAGIGVASVSQGVVDRVDWTINWFMGFYNFVAPVAIFLILTPSLARLFGTSKFGRFGLTVIAGFAVRKLLAGLWAIAFILLVFRIPIVPQGSVSVGAGIMQTLDTLAEMGTTSPYFWAMYLAIGVSLISTRLVILTVVLEKVMNVVEHIGSWFMPLMPVFMFAIGAYVFAIGGNRDRRIGRDGL